MVTFSLRKTDNRTVSTQWYNTKAGIEPHLNSIEKIWALIQARREAGIYGRDERLTTYFINGKIALMSDGNYGIRQWFDKHTTYPLLATYEELQDADTMNCIGIGMPLPWPTDVSCVSGKHWTVVNMHDFYLAPDSTEENRICYTISEYTDMLTSKAKEQLLDAFRKAGFHVTADSFKETKNMYGSFSYRGSWFEVNTEFGVFTIGWRKRVVECTTPSGLGIYCNKIITDPVTKSHNLFHAYSYEKTQEYLHLIYEVLQNK